LDELHLLRAMRYIECNPLRARISRVPWAYRWSSAAAHIGKADRTGLLNLSKWWDIISAKEWMTLLRQEQDEKELEILRTNKYNGRPLGSDRFISKLERLLGCRFRPLPVGRPKKKIIDVKRKNR
jgi:putative transposase